MRNIAFGNRRIFALIALTVWAGLAVSCTPAWTPAAREGSVSAPPHAIHGAELQTAMRNMNQRGTEDVAAELYAGNPASPSMDEIAQSAEAIAEVAKSIPNLVSAMQMPAQDRAEIARLAARLDDKAQVVRNRAKTGNAGAVRAAMNHMNQTCKECHTRFRFGGA
jgi:cytochrome c556